MTRLFSRGSGRDAARCAFSRTHTRAGTMPVIKSVSPVYLYLPAPPPLSLSLSLSLPLSPASRLEKGLPLGTGVALHDVPAIATELESLSPLASAKSSPICCRRLKTRTSLLPFGRAGSLAAILASSCLLFWSISCSRRSSLATCGWHSA